MLPNLGSNDSSGGSATERAITPALAPKALIAALGEALQATWQPVAIPRPTVDPDLERLSGIERVVEVLRFKLLELEYALSPSGVLRGWLRLNLLGGVLLGTPVLLIVPIVTWVLNSFTTWSAFLRQASLNVLYMTLAIAATVAIAIAIHYGAKQYAALNRRNKYRQQQNWRK